MKTENETLWSEPQEGKDLGELLRRGALKNVSITPLGRLMHPRENTEVKKVSSLETGPRKEGQALLSSFLCY